MVHLLNLQLCKQVSAEGGFIQRSVRTVRQSNRDLWAGMPSVHLQHCLVTHQQLLNHSVCVCMCVWTGWIQHHGQSPSEIQRQRILLQSCFVSLHRGRAKRKGQFSVEDAQIDMEIWYRWCVWFLFCCSSLLESMKRCFQPSQIQENANFWRFVIIEFVLIIFNQGGLD